LGQEPDATLTEKGFEQATQLMHFLKNIPVSRIISSPYVRARQSIEPLANYLKIPIETDNRLTERILSKSNLTDWLEKLEQSFENMDLSFHGGESGREAQQRILSVVSDILKQDGKNIILVTHGNLMALLLQHYDPSFGFQKWRALSNPDVYQIDFHEKEITTKRIWKY
jgi:2,3-bisphosphoglycerate-dependent phosphoglycerate mutase